ncbi:MAG TPA: alpha/beta hydrolase [Gemmatimonadaceae bacterium]|nr:alpha/beta hydrolase [Gemmatimonadaceae bacterium]
MTPRDTAGDLGFVHHSAAATGEGGAGTTLLLLHGTGGDEQDLVPLGRGILPGAAILSPRGQVLENGMPRFFRRLAMGVFDVPDLIARTHALADFVGAAAVRYGFDPARVVAVGFSNGANIAASLLLLRPGVLRGAVLFRAMVPLRPESPPRLEGTSVFLSAGRLDAMVPAANTEELAEMLRAAGAEVTLHWEPVGHTLVASEVEEAGRWLLTAVPPPLHIRPG